MVVCKPAAEEVRAIELLVRGRLSNQVKKEMIIASIDTNKEGHEEVVYMSFKWKGRNASKQRNVQF
jgi:tRNA splicing endonuclease